MPAGKPRTTKNVEHFVPDCGVNITPSGWRFAYFDAAHPGRARLLIAVSRIYETSMRLPAQGMADFECTRCSVLHPILAAGPK